MFWFAIIVGILAVMMLHRLLRASSEKAAADQNQTGKRSNPWIMGGGLAVALLLAWRLGLSRAAILSLFPFLRERMGQGGSAHTHGASPPESSASMKRKEAAQLLGVEENATEEEINRSYKALMRKLYPDAGGNSYLAGKLNEARDCLLGK